MTHFSDAKVT